MNNILGKPPSSNYNTENILLTDLKSPKTLIKCIDFGSACFKNQTIYSYIQSRFYRSPEILLGLDYDLSIDMWSLGCICAELYLGLPVFPGVSEYNLLCRFIEMFGDIPNYMLENGKHTLKFYKKVSCGFNMFIYELKTEKEYYMENNQQPKEWRRYFNDEKLDDLILNYPGSKSIRDSDRIHSFIDFLKGLLQYDPAKVGLVLF
jgi:dual specificity protein kinase YAK1